MAMPLSAPVPFTFTLFGASGNLAKLKIYPALYVLALKKRLPPDYAIVGFARTEMDDAAFRKLVEESVQAEMLEVNRKILDDFLSHVHYVQGQYDRTDDFAALGQKLDLLEKGWVDAARLAYLSIPPMVFSPTLKNIVAGKVYNRRGNFRCIIEKPVGHDLASFEKLLGELAGCFEEHDIYFLDHYLGKDAVRNTYYLRFANPILERLFKNTLIQHVEITASEALGLEGRGGYFDSTGTLRDMFQSHLLMMASLLTMHIKDSDELLPESRLNALKQFYLPPATDLNEVVIQAQYTSGKARDEMVVGYQEEEGIAEHSRANTYAALKLLSRESRWQGVPFYLRSGKRLAKKETRISIQFQEPRAVGKGSGPNRLDIILQGEAGMRVHMQTRIGGIEPAWRPLIMEDPLVCVGDCLPEHGLLLLEAIHARKHWFLAPEEIRTAWRLMDPIQSHIDKSDTPLHTYAAGSHGPNEADVWIARDGLKWF